MYERYAIFYTASGLLAEFGAAYFGWDSATGTKMAHPSIVGIDVDTVTATPRKYGLHATLKAPFRMRTGKDLTQLKDALVDFSSRHAAFDIGPLDLVHAQGFVALRPAEPSQILQGFAADVVKVFESFRAPLNPVEIARRRQAQLTPKQDQQMLDWGYPFVFDDFHFHLTLSGHLPDAQAAKLITALTPHLSKIVPNPFRIDAVSLMGQDKEGMFHQLQRSVLTG